MSGENQNTNTPPPQAPQPTPSAPTTRPDSGQTSIQTHGADAPVTKPGKPNRR